MKINIYISDDMSYLIIKGFLRRNYDGYTDLVKISDSLYPYDIASIINGRYKRFEEDKELGTSTNIPILISSFTWSIIKSYITVPINVFEFDQNKELKDITVSL